MNEVHETIAAELRREFETFYPEPQRELWKERNRLFESIESKLAPLIQRTEEMVGEKLHISLNPVPIEVSKPSFDEFSLRIRERTKDIIQKKTARESYVAPKKVEVKEAVWCSDAEYETRTI